MKKTILLGLLPLAVPAVMADYGDVMGPGMMWGYGTTGGWVGMWFLGLIYLAVAAFVFSVVFWLTHNWLVHGKGKK